MKRKRRVKITTTRRRTLNHARTPVLVFCPGCGHEVETLKKSQARELLEVDEQHLGFLIAEGRVHAIEIVSGSVRICKDSLFIK
jgi:hypothetical protein